MKLSIAHTWLVSGAFLVGTAACSSRPGESLASAASSSSANEAVTSSESATSDLASVMPSHLAIMLSMSWFGIPEHGDPLGPGPDTTWGNYEIPGQCSPKGDPAACVDGQRDIASRFRPLAGIGSSSGRDEEGLARIDLMLSNLRRPCADDVGARIDSFAIQLDGTKYTSMHATSPSESAEIPYQALLHAYSEANAAGLTNAVLPANDGTWYFNNGHWVGLDCSTDHAACVAAIQQDAIDMLTLAVENASSLRIADKPVIYFYFASQLTPSEWETIFKVAKSTVIHGATHDFYALGSHQGSGGAPYFVAFDGISPWIDLNAWDNTSGSTVRAHAAEYAASIHEELNAGVPAGHVVLGGIGPGFDDFTNGWSLCETREIPSPPEASPRDPGVLDGMIDYLQTKGTKGVILETWDDWTEGSFFEPSVTEGTSKLEQLQARLGDLYGEPVASAAPLQDRYTAYGQPHGCAGLKPALRTPLCAPPPPACSAPTILEPTASEDVGPSIQLRVSAASCITSITPYIDAAPISAVDGASIDEWVPVTKGTHTLYVTGVDASGQTYTSSKISFDRTY